MRKFVWTALLILTIFVVGCGKKKPRLETEPLTMEDWMVMPAETKYEFATIERLKAGTPKFRNDDEWDKFAHAVMIPARKKELPNGGAGK